MRPVERLLEEGAIRVTPMNDNEIYAIFSSAQTLFKGEVVFEDSVVEKICKMAGGFPYLAQLIGKECIHQLNLCGKRRVSLEILDQVSSDIREGRAFPTLESQYQRAIGESQDRKTLLHFLAEQDVPQDLSNEDVGKVLLKQLRKDVEAFHIEFVDQLLPRLIDKKFGPALFRHPEKQGVYEFENPVLRLYIRLRNL